MKRIPATLIYLRTWFLLDVLASFPYDYLMTDVEEEGAAA